MKGLSLWPFDVVVEVGGGERPFGELDAQTVRTMADRTPATETDAEPSAQGSSTDAQAWRDFANALERDKCSGVEALPSEVAGYWAGRLGLKPPPPVAPPEPHHHHWPL